ncbi:hypothetical protein HD806DRAFT_21680 [Xylariaceae sp. AK1471]|nr:hypothetical protein HD806DRAFT_21680 [Xylariaceae sp. AK1471]
MPSSNAGGILLVLLVLGATTGIVSPVFGERSSSEVVALMDNSHGVVSSSTPLSPEHVFYANSQANFSWDDPRLRRRLWSGQPEIAQDEKPLMSTPTIADEKRDLLQKRAGPPITLATIVKIPSCLGCTLKKHGLLKGTIDELTVDFLERFLIPKDPALLNTCLFYTSLADDKDKAAVQKIGPWYNGPRPPKGLSKPAARYGCNNGLITIWNSFPGANGVTGATPDEMKYNFWEVEVPGTWLYQGLWDPSQKSGLGSQVNVRTYFENLSKAFAKHCGGTIRVMTVDPQKLKKYMYIWGNHELPVLRDNRNSVSGPKPTVLIAINAVDPTMQYMIDWGNDLTPTPISRNDPLYYDPALLSRRDTCDENVYYEPDGEDWFG